MGYNVPMTPLTLHIAGMSCGHCVARVRNALASLPGVQVTEVAVGRADVEIDPAARTADDLVTAVARAGYDARVDSAG